MHESPQLISITPILQSLLTLGSCNLLTQTSQTLCFSVQLYDKVCITGQRRKESEENTCLRTILTINISLEFSSHRHKILAQNTNGCALKHTSTQVTRSLTPHGVRSHLLSTVRPAHHGYTGSARPQPLTTVTAAQHGHSGSGGSHPLGVVKQGHACWALVKQGHTRSAWTNRVTPPGYWSSRVTPAQRGHTPSAYVGPTSSSTGSLPCALSEGASHV